MDSVTIASIVEGFGEVRALPVLRRIAGELGVWNLHVPPPFRIPRSKLVRPAELVNAVIAMAERVPGAGGVLVLLDADDDCPAQLGPRMLEHARAARPETTVAVVLAQREFEAWFVASAASVAGRRGIVTPLANQSIPRAFVTPRAGSPAGCWATPTSQRLIRPRWLRYST